MLAVIVVVPVLDEWPVAEVWVDENGQLEGWGFRAGEQQVLQPDPAWGTIADVLKAKNRGVVHATFANALTIESLQKKLGKPYKSPES